MSYTSGNGKTHANVSLAYFFVFSVERAYGMVLPTVRLDFSPPLKLLGSVKPSQADSED